MEFIKSRNPEGYQVTEHDLVWRLGENMTDAEKIYAASLGVKMVRNPDRPNAIDRTGFDLGDGSMGTKVNLVSKESFYSFSFDVLPGHTLALIRTYGAPGQFFDTVNYTITSPTGAILVGPKVEKTIGGVDIRFQPPGSGKYSVTLNVNGSGSLGVEYKPS